ncbi:PRK06770 family protein [Bacillus sp. ISL-46]|nr:PRK06770 family protein [Bacillus sp. ISL-46]
MNSEFFVKLELSSKTGGDEVKIVLIVTGIILAVLIGVKYGGFKPVDNGAESGKKQEKVEAKAVQDTVNNEKKEVDKQQTAKIGGVQYDIGIDDSSSQDAVIEVMHKMTHQKVKAKEKWGAIPMIPDTINQVYDIVENSEFEQKDDLLAILDKWKKGIFSEVDDDHNYFWTYQGGTIGKAYGIMSKSEEETFIQNNFEEDIVREVSSQH